MAENKTKIICLNAADRIQLVEKVRGVEMKLISLTSENPFIKHSEKNRKERKKERERITQILSHNTLISNNQ